MPTSIAIDGPSGAGKSTLARRLAEELEYIYIDTGALYRTVGLHAVRKTGGYDNPAAVIASLKSIDIKMKLDDGNQVILLDGEPVGDNIRTPLISMAASAVSAIPAVRDFLMDFQRGVAAKNSVVMDGRDIGTVVLPDAKIKVFLTASPEIRAKRRYHELIEKGKKVTYEEVLSDLIKRDADDSGRAVAPLKPAPDSITADTTNLDLQQSFELLMRIVNRKLAEEKRLKKHAVKKAERELYSVTWQGSVQKKLRKFAFWLFRVKVTGIENIPKEGQVVICLNHLSYLDPVLAGFASPRPINYIAKSSLFTKPVLGFLIRKLGALPIDRDKPEVGVFRTIGNLLEKGRAIGIFPEGTRSKKTYQMQQGKAGVGMIVLRAGAPVVPVLLDYPKRAGIFKQTIIKFGKAIPAEQLDVGTGKQRFQACADAIMASIAALKEPELK